jgi:two-component system sensor histidine kinase FlrB
MTQQTTGRNRELEDAFNVFNRMSLQLESSYRDLEQQVAGLTAELAAARSERLRQLAEKERLANRLTRLLETLPGGVIVLDAQGIVQECNPAALTLLGEPLLGQLWRDVMQRVCAAPCGADDSDIQLVNGRQVTLSARPLGTEPGQILLLTDVTEHRALQNLVNRQQRLSAMGEMAASLAHQIRTPLATALLYLSHLNRPQQAEAERLRVTEKIRARLRHLEGMVNDMLVFARGGGSGAIEKVSIDSVLDELRQTLEPQLQTLRGELDIDNAAPGAIVNGSRAALAGALLNLASNAVQSCGSGVRLRITVRTPQPGRLTLCISDNGPGIPAACIDRIFEPFFTTRPDGTGLGLAVVRAVAEAHHGSVWAASPPGQGACFGLRLPYQPAAARVSRHTRATPRAVSQSAHSQTYEVIP